MEVQVICMYLCRFLSSIRMYVCCWIIGWYRRVRERERERACMLIIIGITAAYVNALL